MKKFYTYILIIILILFSNCNNLNAAHDQDPSKLSNSLKKKKSNNSSRKIKDNKSNNSSCKINDNKSNKSGLRIKSNKSNNSSLNKLKDNKSNSFDLKVKNNKNNNLDLKINDNTDWQNLSRHSDKSIRLCSGCYVESKYPVDITQNVDPDTLVINADRTKLIPKGKSTFEGNVVIAKNNQKLTTERAIVTQNSEGRIASFLAIGKVKLLEPGIRLLGSKGNFIVQENYKIMYNINYRIYNRHATGDAEQLEVFEDQTMIMPNATYTTCAPNNQVWKLHAKRVKLNQVTGRGEAWHAKMYIKDVPIFYWPYVNFPLDKRRQTGFLLPIINNNTNDGFTVGLPWYWNIATNYDYTFSPIYMTKRGLKVNNQFRYLTNKSLGVIRFNFIFKDNAYKNYINEKISHRTAILDNDLRYNRLFNAKKNVRYGITYHNINYINNIGKMYINYNKVSDDHYLKDFGKDLGQVRLNSSFKNFGKYHNLYGAGASIEELSHSSSQHLEQSIGLENSNQYGIFNIRLHQYQTIYPLVATKSEEQFKKFPEINWYNHAVQIAPMTYARFNFNYTDFKLRKIENLEPKTTGNRLNLRPSIEYSMLNSYGYSRSRLQLDILNYHNLKLNKFDLSANKPTNSARIIPIFDINNGLYLYKNLSNNWQQMLEPRIYYLYVPKRKQDHYPVFDSQFIEYSYHQLFRDNRFTGYDRLADANQITFGIKTSLNFKGEEKASFAIARARTFTRQIPYLQEQLVPGKWSPIAMLLNYRVSSKCFLENNLVMDQLIKRFRTNTITSQYVFSEDKIINLSYQYSKYKEIPEHQWQASSVWAVNDRFNLLAKIDYDLSRKKILYSLAGLEFNSCCTIMRLVVAKHLLFSEDSVKAKYNNKFLAQIIFKGFADLGDLEDNYLSSKIAGHKSIF